MTSPWRTLVCLDTETTGIDTDTARIVQAAVVILHPDTQPQTHSWLVNPGVHIPQQATDVHGISDDDVKDAITEPDAITEIARVIETAHPFSALVVYNAPYDLRVINSAVRRSGITYRLFAAAMRTKLSRATYVYDPLVIDRHYEKYRRGKRTLTAQCERLGITLDDAHTAGADALAAGLVARAQIDLYGLHQYTPAELHQKQIGWAAEQRSSFADWLARQGRGDETKRVRNETWPR